MSAQQIPSSRDRVFLLPLIIGFLVDELFLSNSMGAVVGPNLLCRHRACGPLLEHQGFLMPDFTSDRYEIAPDTFFLRILDFIAEGNRCQELARALCIRGRRA